MSPKSDEIVYEPLLPDDTQHDRVDFKCEHRRLRKTIYCMSGALLILLISNFVFITKLSRVKECHAEPFLTFCALSLSPRNLALIMELSAPAQEAVDYEVVKFHAGPLNDEPDDMYSMPPSPSVDGAWRELYEFGAIHVTPDVASKLANSSEKMYTENESIFGIDVFHQLHCLNKIRKALHPDYYARDITEAKEVYDTHINHCLNSVRQSLQCGADISTVPFNVQPLKFSSKPILVPTFNVIHTCRNFRKLQEWTRARWTGEMIDMD
ncbi:hypothetical protein C8J57DRAFT_1492999 [Mycena rebaudengoi]|nr:hypothetical protein C8J57DRAFT_1492999 [Mycena rebaudengoi]